jgi:hypothetical protein
VDGFTGDNEIESYSLREDLSRGKWQPQIGDIAWSTLFITLCNVRYPSKLPDATFQEGVNASARSQIYSQILFKAHQFMHHHPRWTRGAGSRAGCSCMHLRDSLICPRIPIAPDAPILNKWQECRRVKPAVRLRHKIGFQPIVSEENKTGVRLVV